MPRQTYTLQQLRVGLLSTNCYLLFQEDRDDCIIIDPGAEPERITAALNGRRIAAILLTHGHFDHIGGVDALMQDGTQLYVHEADASMLRDPQLNVSWMVDDTVICREATRLLHEGDLVEAAGLSLTVLHTPGHTPGCVCYELDDDLFTGDTLFDQGYGRTDLPGGSMLELRRSLQRLWPYRETHHIHGGHG